MVGRALPAPPRPDMRTRAGFGSCGEVVELVRIEGGGSLRGANAGPVASGPCVKTEGW